ncbi:4'-phosphopantetheinyl transferase family protein [Pseudoalteromonas xiamenensis]
MYFSQLPSVQSTLSNASFALRFDMDSFEQQDFEVHGLSFPPKLDKAVPKRRAEFLAGRICAQHALSMVGVNDFQVLAGQDRAPIWPKNVLGAITHSKGLAMAVVVDASAYKGIGLDIEHFMSDKREHDLQKHLLCEQEQTQFKLLGHVCSHPLTLVFSAKESIFKALYPSVNAFFGFEAAALIEFNNTQLRFEITKSLSDLVQKGTQVTVHYQHFENWLLTECCV